jgi:hypothetical protein
MGCKINAPMKTIYLDKTDLSISYKMDPLADYKVLDDHEPTPNEINYSDVISKFLPKVDKEVKEVPKVQVPNEVVKEVPKVQVPNEVVKEVSDDDQLKEYKRQIKNEDGIMSDNEARGRGTFKPIITESQYTQLLQAETLQSLYKLLEGIKGKHTLFQKIYDGKKIVSERGGGGKKITKYVLGKDRIVSKYDRKEYIIYGGKKMSIVDARIKEKEKTKANVVKKTHTTKANVVKK